MYGWTKPFYLCTILELVSRGNNTSRTQHGPHFIVTLSTTYLNGIRGNKYPLSTILFYLHCITTVRDNGPVTRFMLESNLLIWLLPSFSKNNSPLFAKVVLDGGGVGEGVDEEDDGKTSKQRRLSSSLLTGTLAEKNKN